MSWTDNLLLLNMMTILRIASITELWRADPKVHDHWVWKVICLLLVAV